MGKPYSGDFRKGAVAAVVSGGLSCNEAARQFGVAVSTVIGWVRRQRQTGSLVPGKMGGHRAKAISGEHRVWMLERIGAGDFTLRGLVAELEKVLLPTLRPGDIVIMDNSAATEAVSCASSSAP
jgi:transposase